MITTGAFTRIIVGAKTVGTSAVLMATGDATLEGRNAILIFNNSSSIIYLGDENVTDDDGYPLLPNDQILLQTGADVYAVAAAGSNDVRVWEII